MPFKVPKFRAFQKKKKHSFIRVFMLEFKTHLSKKEKHEKDKKEH